MKKQPRFAASAVVLLMLANGRWPTTAISSDVRRRRAGSKWRSGTSTGGFS
jgi:hypothetical protein